ncbi:MAG TPA: Gfo/Idh/MocA family oxidoreductase [Spirochaetia bacterium]|nr:Gfo/Idh/MocA family oxidoreductase [Spirochaetia bacterium]
MTKVAVIGAGNIAAAHIRGYREFPDQCRIVALVDIDREKAQARNKEFSLDAKIYPTIEELLNSEKVDLVSVCTPPFTHKDITVMALRAGLNVLCEKPMASSLEECDEMLAAQRDSGALLSIVTNNRFRSDIVALKTVLDSGLAGAVVQAQVDSFWWRGLVYYDLWWRGTWEKEGGGCTLNHGVHHVDLFQWMMGMPESVSATIANLAHPNAEVEDCSVSILRFPANRVGVLTCSVVHHGEEQKMIFQCEKAKISVPWGSFASTSTPTGFPIENTGLNAELDRLHSSVGALKHEGHSGQIENLLSTIEGRGPLAVDGIEGRKTLELISAIYQSGVTHSEVRLPLGKNEPFYTRDGILKNAVRFHEKKGATEFQSGKS